jgi:hypothetical protein
MFAVACWGGNKAFSTYLDKKLELETMRQHEETLQKQVQFFEKLIK